MISLIQFPYPPHRPSFSPFCLKLESYLRIANIPYENRLTVSMGRSTKKKMPMIEENGTLIEDSGFIIDYLKQTRGIDLDTHLSAEQKAITKAFQWLCEKSIVDIVICLRWCDVDNWPVFREVVFAKAPWIIRMTVANIISSNLKKTMYKQGMGRFSNDEKLKILHANLRAISDYLSDKKYFFGDQVSTIDTIIFSTLVQVQPRGVIKQFEGVLDKYPNLIAYIQRFTKTYWPQFL